MPKEPEQPPLDWPNEADLDRFGSEEPPEATQRQTEATDMTPADLWEITSASAVTPPET
jgi:hypothetical protein